MRRMLSGITTAKIPPKNSQAASKPSMTASVVWVKVSHTKQWRRQQGVKISACRTRRRSVSGSDIRPMRPKSTWSSTPGSPSATRTVVLLATARPAQLRAEALARCAWGRPPPAGQQGVDLDDGQALVVEPGSDLLLMAIEGAPGLAVADCCDGAGPARAPRRGPRRSAGPPRRRGRRRTRPRRPRNGGPSCGRPWPDARSLAALRPGARAGAPLSPRTRVPPGIPSPLLCPLPMAASGPDQRPALVDPPGVVPLLAEGWSHARGGTQLKVVPCSLAGDTLITSV